LNAFIIAHDKLLWYDQLKFKVRNLLSILKMTNVVAMHGYDDDMVDSFWSSLQKIRTFLNFCRSK